MVSIFWKTCPWKFVWSETWVAFTASSKWDCVYYERAEQRHMSTENSWGNRFLNSLFKKQQQKKSANFQVLSSRTYLLAGRFLLHFFLVKYLYIFAYTTCVFVFSKYMIYLNYSSYIHQEILNYILWYIKEYNKTSFLYKAKTKGTWRRAKWNLVKNYGLMSIKPNVKELLHINSKHHGSAYVWKYITDKILPKTIVSTM